MICEVRGPVLQAPVASKNDCIGCLSGSEWSGAKFASFKHLGMPDSQDVNIWTAESWNVDSANQILAKVNQGLAFGAGEYARWANCLCDLHRGK